MPILKPDEGTGDFYSNLYLANCKDQLMYTTGRIDDRENDFQVKARENHCFMKYQGPKDDASIRKAILNGEAMPRLSFKSVRDISWGVGKWKDSETIDGLVKLVKQGY